MLKARLSLSAVALLACSLMAMAVYFAATEADLHSWWAPLLGILGFFLAPMMLIAAITMLVFSLFRAHQTDDGRLAYNPGNPYWRFMKYTFAWKGTVSLCAAYWQTVLIETMGLLGLCTVAGLSSAIYYNGIGEVLGSFKVLAPVLFFFGSFVIPAIILNYSTESESGRIVGHTLLLLSVVGWFVVAPLYVFIFGQGLTTAAAFIKYLKFAALIVGVTIGGGLAVAALAWFISSLAEDSLLKRLFATIKEKGCPLLYEDSKMG